MLKDVMRAEDAPRAVDAGVMAISVRSSAADLGRENVVSRPGLRGGKRPKSAP
jgi:hypothetical protein